MSAMGMADVIAAHQYGPGGFCECQSWNVFEFDMGSHDVHVMRELAKAGYGNVQEAKAEALTDAADWLVNGEAAGIIACDGPSNRGEVMAAYDAALEDPEAWLRERAEAARAVDPAALYCYARDGMAEAWREGRAAGADTLNPYEDWPSTSEDKP